MSLETKILLFLPDKGGMTTEEISSKLELEENDEDLLGAIACLQHEKKITNAGNPMKVIHLPCGMTGYATRWTKT